MIVVISDNIHIITNVITISGLQKSEHIMIDTNVVAHITADMYTRHSKSILYRAGIAHIEYLCNVTSRSQ